MAVLALSVAGCGSDQPAEPGNTASTAPAVMPQSNSPPGATVFFITPADGATVTSPVDVKFGISGMAIVPAGEAADNSGHHHILVDTSLSDTSQPIPKDAQHIHFGSGQTETVLELAPGTHTLQLVLGDANHVPHVPPVMSNTITITVE